jgi:hypothetical protein
LISRLLSRRHQPESTESFFITWSGQSGAEYQFTIYPIDATLPPLPGVYVYARQEEDGQWTPLYIAQTRDMHQRLEGHEKLQDAIENGASHIHVNLSASGQAARCTEERDLIARWQPLFNERMES